MATLKAMVPCRLISILITLYQGILMSAFFISVTVQALYQTAYLKLACTSPLYVHLTHILPPEELMIMVLLWWDKSFLSRSVSFPCSLAYPRKLSWVLTDNTRGSTWRCAFRLHISKLSDRSKQNTHNPPHSLFFLHQVQVSVSFTSIMLQ